MKKISGIIIILVILSAAVWILTLRKNYSESIEDVIRLQAVVDSVKSIEATPPDTVLITETVIHEKIKTVTIFKDRPAQYNTFKDSIINDSIRVRIKITADQVFDVTWNYESIIIRDTKTINKPYPVIVDNPIPVPASGYYVVGGGSFAGGLIPEIGLYKLKKNTIFGIKAMGVSGKVGIGIAFGIKL